MITIPNYSVSLTPFTLTENTTYPLDQVKYILELYSNQLHDNTLLFLTGETSPNILRWNYYPIDLRPYNLVSGTYDYRVYQTTGSTLSVSTENIVESGLAQLTSTGGTQTTIYSGSSGTQYVFE